MPKDHELTSTSSVDCPEMDDQFTGAFPRYSGAINSVTGGPPEDMNQMPATHNPSEDGPIYDGSDLEPFDSQERKK